MSQMNQVLTLLGKLDDLHAELAKRSELVGARWDWAARTAEEAEARQDTERAEKAWKLAGKLEGAHEALHTRLDHAQKAKELVEEIEFSIATRVPSQRKRDRELTAILNGSRA